MVCESHLKELRGLFLRHLYLICGFQLFRWFLDLCACSQFCHFSMSHMISWILGSVLSSCVFAVVCCEVLSLTMVILFVWQKWCDNSMLQLSSHWLLVGCFKLFGCWFQEFCALSKLTCYKDSLFSNGKKFVLCRAWFPPWWPVWF